MRRDSSEEADVEDGKRSTKKTRSYFLEGIEGSMVGAKKIFVVIKSLRFFNSMRHVSAAGRGHLGARGTRVKVPGGGGGSGAGRRTKETEHTKAAWQGGRNGRNGSRREKRRHDDRAINNIGEKGDRLQHSAQMLNRYQFNAVQSASRWAVQERRGLVGRIVVGDATRRVAGSQTRVVAETW